jgi:ABC-type branched-subunit amino acid transport system substrate-binding protein
VLISAIDERSSILLTKQVAHAIPDATIFATGALADSAFTDPAVGGIPAWLDARVLLVSATLDADAYPLAGRAFLSTYARTFGIAEPSAIYGYAAMRLMLHAIARATDGGHRAAYRAKVVAAITRTARLRSPLGAYRIDAAGDTTIGRYGIYRIVGGRLSYIQDSR